MALFCEACSRSSQQYLDFPTDAVEKDCRIFLQQIIFLYEEKKMDKNLLPEI